MRVFKNGDKKRTWKKIKRIRQNRGMTQEQLAEAVNISQRTLSGIEIGENFVTAETLDKIISALNTTPEELFSISHLKDRNELTKEINTNIKKLSDNREKLELIYKFIKSLLID